MNTILRQHFKQIKMNPKNYDKKDQILNKDRVRGGGSHLAKAKSQREGSCKVSWPHSQHPGEGAWPGKGDLGGGAQRPL